MEKEWVQEHVKKSFLMAFEGYKSALKAILGRDELDFDIDMARLAPVAAEVFRMTTQPVLVTVDDGVKMTRGNMHELQDSLSNLGYRGIITVNSITIEFPASEPVKVNVQGIVEEGQ
jgi:hypothetical protein